MEQGKDLYENQPLPVAPGMIDTILLTHAHIDHSGRIPLLTRQGYHGPIHATQATAELCDIMLRDSGHIQEFEAEWRNRKARRSGEDLYEPLYTVQDATAAMEQFVGHAYGERFCVLPGVEARFVDVGHLLGSASIELWVTERGETKKLVFSGDIGNSNQPLLRDPTYLTQADYVVMESTYGDRSHGARPDYVAELAQILQDTFDRGGNVVIPSFAVGRTQEMLYFLRQIKTQNLIKGHDCFKVYVDSPLAIEATQIFKDSWAECYDAEAKNLVEQNINPLQFPDLYLSTTSDTSRAINFDDTPKVILSASGMCEAGRIRHHLKHNLWRSQSTVLFVGYQSVGTLGRMLVDGAKQVNLFGEPIEVRCQIKVLAGVSGHADDQGLLHWASHFAPKPKQIFVVHGDDAVCDQFAERLRSELQIPAVAPYNGGRYDLDFGVCIEPGNQVRVQSRKRGRPAKVFDRLVTAAQRLLALAQSKEGQPNKDLARFADQITALCDRWKD
jgi:metallo-beta-lactamase family protein